MGAAGLYMCIVTLAKAFKRRPSSIPISRFSILQNYHLVSQGGHESDNDQET